MNLGQALRGCSLIATLLLAACGSSGDDSSGLLDDDGSSSGGGSSSRYLIEIAGPDCVEPGVTATGYTATVTRPSGAVAPEVFVALSATINGTASGTIRATLPDGRTVVWPGVNLCQVKVVTLNQKAGGALWVDYE